ncbi:MAG: hypothetical protein IJL87_04435 [Clostridia bacterium]|nr:hypothetical protein [Clostridia bacterium]
MKKTLSAILALFFIFSCMQGIWGVYAYYDNEDVVVTVDESSWTQNWCTDTNPIRVFDPTYYFSCPPYLEDDEDHATFIDGDGDGKAPELSVGTYVDGKQESSDLSYRSKCGKNTDDFIVSPAINPKKDRTVTFTWNVALSGDSKCTVYLYTGSELSAEKIKSEGRVLSEITESGKGDMRAVVPQGKDSYLVIGHTGTSGELTVRRMGGSYVRKKGVDFKLESGAAAEDEEQPDDPNAEEIEEPENQTMYLDEVVADFLRSFPEAGKAVYPYSEGEDSAERSYGLYTTTLRWSENDRTCAADEVFKPGVVYTREITITPKEGTVFKSPLKVLEAEKSEYFENLEPDDNGSVTLREKITGGRFAEFKRPRVRSVGYGTSLILHAECGFGVEGIKYKWDVSGDAFDYEISEDTLTCKVTPKKAGTATFKITVDDETLERYLNQIETRSDTVTITAKMGFWQKFTNFFRKLFGIKKIYD